MLSSLPYDILHTIKQFLTYKERTYYLRLCSSFSTLFIEHFRPFTIHCVKWPKRDDPSYLLVYHPFEIPYYSHPHTFIGHHYVGIILYDTPFTYYHIRTTRIFCPTKTIQDYLRDYEPYQYHINKITRYVDG